MHGVSFQIVQGIWSPIDQCHTFVIVDEFRSYKEAKKAAKEWADEPLPFMILEIRSKVMWRNAAAEPKDASGAQSEAHPREDQESR